MRIAIETGRVEYEHIPVAYWNNATKVFEPISGSAYSEIMCQMLSGAKLQQSNMDLSGSGTETNNAVPTGNTFTIGFNPVVKTNWGIPVQMILEPSIRYMRTTADYSGGYAIVIPFDEYQQEANFLGDIARCTCKCSEGNHKPKEPESLPGSYIPPGMG